MIYTVTFNPALDYVVDMADFRLGEINRTEREIIYPGGKGINVSLVLKNLGYDSVALGFEAGHTGDMLIGMLRSFGCRSDFVHVAQGATRINVKVRAKGENAPETAINGQGPKISSEELKALYDRLDKLQSGDILVLAGSVPSSLSFDTYSDIMSCLEKKDVSFVVDATGELMLNALRHKPFLIKPNDEELGEIFGKKLTTKEEIWEHAEKLQELGARNVLISRGGDGAMFIGEDGTRLECPAPEGKLVNSVGAGDAMVAGFLAGWLEYGDYKTAFKMGICSGSATAFKDWLAEKEDVEALLEKI